ncbi:MAG TPA: proteinase IV [Clostridium sp.]|jgi:serine protease inhibitor|nr:proteinase IV [Clostridium sp.]
MSKKIVYVIILTLLSSLLFATNTLAYGDQASYQQLNSDLIATENKSENLLQKTNSVVFGDLNGDGFVNSLDYTLIKRYVLGEPNSFTEDYIIAADLNGDKYVSSTDCALLKRYILDILQQFPVEAQKPTEGISDGFIEGNSKFAFDIFKEISKDEEGENIFISPFCISTALSILYQGAGSDTKEEMTKVLGYESLEIAEVNKSYKYLLNYFNQLTEDVKLKNSNSIWINSLLGDNIIKADFISTNQDVFNTLVESRDFSEEGIADEINNWISEATEGKIDKMLDKVPAEMLSYIISAVYFKGIWTEEFDADRTDISRFYDEDGNTENVMMMAKEGELEYGEGDGYKAVKLPYGDGEMTMYCILPDENTPINDFIQNIDLLKWNEIKNSISKNDDVLLKLPRFKIEYAKDNSGSLKESLKALGMKKAFEDDADLSGMSDISALVDDVLHKAVVEVNEKGTEAAGVVIIPIGPTSVLRPTFIANRPFVFVIADEEYDTILFMGKVCNGSFDN